MHVTFFCTASAASFAANAILRPGDEHDLVTHIVSVLVLALEGFFNEFKYIKSTDLVTSATADALVCVNGIDEFGGPGLSAPCSSGDRGHDLSLEHGAKGMGFALFSLRFILRYCFSVLLARPDSHRVLYGRDEYLAVAGLAGLVHLDDGLDKRCDDVVRHHDR
jgi:hypothetical protein